MIPLDYSVERLMCEVEFFWEVCFKVRYADFLMWLRSPRPNYQIVDLESFLIV